MKTDKEGFDRWAAACLGILVGLTASAYFVEKPKPELEMGHRVEQLKTAASPDEVRRHIEQQLAVLNSRGGLDEQVYAYACGFVGESEWSGVFRRHFDGDHEFWTFENREDTCRIFIDPPAEAPSITKIPGFPVEAKTI